VLYYKYEQTIQQHHSGRYAMACGLGVSVANVGRLIMASPIQRIEALVNEFDIDVFLNALQQICFCNAADQREFENDKIESGYWMDIGKSLDSAIKITKQ